MTSPAARPGDLAPDRGDEKATLSGGGPSLLGERNVNMGTPEISLIRADLSGGGIAFTEEVDLDLEGACWTRTPRVSTAVGHRTPQTRGVP